MNTLSSRPGEGPPRSLHPLRALLLAGCVPLFLGVLLSDVAYNGSDQVQWKNFASWMNAGALVLCGFALLWALVGLARADRRRGWTVLSAVLLLVGFVLGFVNSLLHAKDAAASMSGAAVLSLVVFALLAVASWLGFSDRRTEVRA